MILKSHKYVKVKVKDYSDRGVSLSNLPMEKLVSDLLNFWPNDVLIVTVCWGSVQAEIVRLQIILVRGGVTKKKRENLGQCPN